MCQYSYQNSCSFADHPTGFQGSLTFSVTLRELLRRSKQDSFTSAPNAGPVWGVLVKTETPRNLLGTEVGSGHSGTCELDSPPRGHEVFPVFFFFSFICDLKLFMSPVEFGSSALNTVLKLCPIGHNDDGHLSLRAGSTDGFLKLPFHV